MTEIAQHYDEGKPPLALLPPAGLREVAKVMAYGARKYGQWNWRKGNTYLNFCNSALRHIYAHLDEETVDPESECLHLAHAACNLLFMLQWMTDGNVTDDRYHRFPLGCAAPDAPEIPPWKLSRVAPGEEYPEPTSEYDLEESRNEQEKMNRESGW